MRTPTPIHLVLASVLVLALSSAVAQPQDYQVVCSDDGGTTIDATIGVAMLVEGVWHVRLDEAAFEDEGELPCGAAAGSVTVYVVDAAGGSTVATLTSLPPAIEDDEAGFEIVIGEGEDAATATVEAVLPSVAIEGMLKAQQNRERAREHGESAGRPEWAGPPAEGEAPGRSGDAPRGSASSGGRPAADGRTTLPRRFQRGTVSP